MSKLILQISLILTSLAGGSEAYGWDKLDTPSGDDIQYSSQFSTEEGSDSDDPANLLATCLGSFNLAGANPDSFYQSHHVSSTPSSFYSIRAPPVYS